MIEVAPRVLVGAWQGTGLTFQGGAAVLFGQHEAEIAASETESVAVSYVVLRSVDLTASCAVEWELGGTLTSGFLVDGQAMSGTLHFGPGVEQQVVTVRLKAQASGTPDKELTITLSNADNCRIAGETTATTAVRMPRSGPTLIVRNDAYVVQQGTVTVLPVLDNDDPATGKSISGLQTPAQGSARRVNNSQAIEYTAPPIGGFSGKVTFTYSVAHPATNEARTGTVEVTVQSAFAVAADRIGVARGTFVFVSPLANDAPAGGVELVSFTAPVRGKTSRVTDTDQIKYEAPPASSNYTGRDDFSYTARHTASGATASATVEVTVRAPSSLPLGTVGPNSGLPWWSGTVQTGKDLEAIRNRESDIVCLFGGWGKGGTIEQGWADLAGGTITGSSVKLDGCFSGFNGRNGSKNEWVQNPQIMPLWSYHALPAKVDNNNLTTLRGYYNNIAAGNYDADVYLPCVAKLNRIMLNYGYQAVILRLMHEMNGSHYSHSVMAQYDEFIAAWQHVAAIFRNNMSMGLSLYTDWNCAKNGGGGTISPEHYPGDTFVDIISMDYYDRNMSPKITSLANFNTVAAQMRGGGLYGIKTYLDFAKSRGKLFGVAEWGCMLPATHSGAAGDNPEFINGMYQFFRNNAADIAYECYFNQSDSRLTQHPLARAKYRELWGR